jgi:hypothetical protein
MGKTAEALKALLGEHGIEVEIVDLPPREGRIADFEADVAKSGDETMIADVKDLRTRFTYHPPREDAQREFYETWRVVVHHTAAGLLQRLPPSRERSLALTKLEEAVMWGNAAAARGGLRE